MVQSQAAILNSNTVLPLTNKFISLKDIIDKGLINGNVAKSPGVTEIAASRLMEI